MSLGPWPRVLAMVSAFVVGFIGASLAIVPDSNAVASSAADPTVGSLSTGVSTSTSLPTVLLVPTVRRPNIRPSRSADLPAAVRGAPLHRLPSMAAWLPFPIAALTSVALAVRRWGHQTAPNDLALCASSGNFFENLFQARQGESKIAAWTPGRKKIGNCTTCSNKGSIMCPGCKGKGRSRVNGNIMERFKCMVCQGVGLVACPECDRGGKGLTPEQRGER